MRALLQRVDRASVRWAGGEARSIGRGLLIFLGVGQDDGEDEARRLADKSAGLRIFPNAEGKFDRSAADQGLEVLVISQFTLYADSSRGRRPDFTAAAAPEKARPLYERFAEILVEKGLPVKTGHFGAHMAVELLNDGPVTIWLDSDEL